MRQLYLTLWLRLLLLPLYYSYDAYEGHLIRREKDEMAPVYLIHRGEKLMVLNTKTLVECLQSSNSDVVDVPHSIISLYQIGPNLDCGSSSYGEISSQIDISIIKVPVQDTVNVNEIVNDGPKTLVIIFGQYRTFDLTCSGIFDHVVKPNLPVTVVIVLDEPKFHLTRAVHLCLRPFTHVVRIINWLKCTDKSVVEFCLVEKGFSWAESLNETFTHAISVRTDNIIETDISVTTVFGHTASFFSQFIRFEKFLEGEYNQRGFPSPSYHERLWAWIYSGGIQAFVKHMIFNSYESPWTKIYASDWNQAMRQYVFSQPNEDRLRSTKGAYYHYQHAVEKALLNITETYPIHYLIGSTWVCYGRYATRRAISKYMVEKYGKATFDSSPPSWTGATENQLRFAFWTLGYNLVDLINPEDYRKSFAAEDTSSLIEDERNPALIVYLLRTCERYKLRSECGRRRRRLTGRTGRSHNATLSHSIA